MTRPEDINLRYWNEVAPLHRHAKDGLYRTDEFLAGVDVLSEAEGREVGDLTGKSLRHLQCHFGLDTLCMARRGATVTGLDYSSAAITEARALAATAGLAATFVEADLYDAPARIDGLFDLVFVHWGAINWLRDIRRWAQIVAGFLAPGGYLYFIDSHPVTLTLEWVQEAHLQPTYPYFSTDQPLEFETETSYNEDGTKLTHTKSYELMHGISDVVMALLDAGLRLDFLHEHDLLAWRLFPCMQPTPEHDFKLPDTMPSLPLAYSLEQIQSKRNRF